MTDTSERHPMLGRRALLASSLAGAGALSLPLHRARAAAMSAPGRDSLLTAQTTEGPYYLALDLVRQDITEGLPGIPLDVAFTVLDEAGQPYEGALVDIWHCNARGNYSGFSQPGGDGKDTGTFLRGTQRVDRNGLATFHSIYPGWYRGRTTHIHFKVRRGPLTNLTSQFFLPDTLSEYLYTQLDAYRRSEVRDTLNSTDGIAIDAGQTVEGAVREGDGRYVASLLVRVDRNADPAIDRPPAPGRSGPGGRPPGPPPSDRSGPPSGHQGPPPGPGMSPGVSPEMSNAPTGKQRIAAMLPDAPRKPNGPPMPPPNGGPRNTGD